MIVKVYLKDPDGFYESIQESVKRTLQSLDGLSDTERGLLMESRMEEAGNKMRKWVEYGEYVTLEFDLDTMTAGVVERSF